MSLTVAERQHWRDRVAARIDKRVESLVAKQDPSFLKGVGEKAREEALNSLGIAEQEKRLAELELQIKQTEKLQREARAQQRAIIRGTKAEDEMHYVPTYCTYDKEVAGAVDGRAKVHEADILAQTELGRQILTLNAEKENLLDTVWLATSCRQIKQLWEQVNALLQCDPTELEAKALSIEAPEAE